LSFADMKADTSIRQIHSFLLAIAAHVHDYDNDGRKDLLSAQGHDLDTIEVNFPQLSTNPLPVLCARNIGSLYLSPGLGGARDDCWRYR
jgi:hypothetical protein